MPRIQIYTTRWCGFCVRAKTLLDSRGLAYEEISLDDDPAFRQTVLDATGGWTVPQILIECAGSAAGEAGDARRKSNGAHREELDEIRELLVAARDLWVSVPDAPDGERRPRVRAAARLIQIADTVAVTTV